MEQDGVFGPERKRSHGRPRWRLVDESLGREVDTSSTFCEPVKAKALKRTVDADKEEWDVIDKDVKCRDVATSGDEDAAPIQRIRKKPKKARSAVKPLTGKAPVIKPIKPASVRQDSLSEVAPTPQRASDDPASHDVSPVWTPSQRRRRRPVQVVSSPRRSPKRKAADDNMNPIRKARKMTSSGARRSVLQL